MKSNKDLDDKKFNTSHYGKKKIHSRSESLTLFPTNLLKKEHQTQMFAILLLREVEELCDNEKFLLSSISIVEADLSHSSSK